ncbi:type IV pili methyl-accepting chemotaxis transducer N-terminal domain-containing protein [Thiolapillus sp.]
MNNLNKTLWILLVCAAAFLFAGTAFAKAEQSVDSGNDNLANLIDIAGKQRMLSQKIAKAYFFYGKGIRRDKTHKQLLDSIREFDQNFEIIRKSTNNPAIQDMLVFIEMAKDELAQLAKQPYNKENASLVLDYSETMLEGSQDIVSRLEEESKLKKEAIVDLAGRQRMLTQRIAKYYIAYQAGFRDHNTIDQLKTAVKEFEQAQAVLLKAKRNTPEIKNKLKKVEKLWHVVAKFYKDVERGGLPVIVLATTDDIMATMNQVTHQYAELLGS